MQSLQSSLSKRRNGRDGDQARIQAVQREREGEREREGGEVIGGTTIGNDVRVTKGVQYERLGIPRRDNGYLAVTRVGGVRGEGTGRTSKGVVHLLLLMLVVGGECVLARLLG
jgi:hypothetical protein